MNRDKLETEILEREQSKLQKFRISYYYLATGMEGVPDIFPEKIIEAPSRDMAAYIYCMMFFEGMRGKSFSEFEKQDAVYRYWGLTMMEL